MLLSEFLSIVDVSIYRNIFDFCHYPLAATGCAEREKMDATP